MAAARAKGMKTIAWCGQDPRGMGPLADIVVSVPSSVTARIQESHITLGHILIHLVERAGLSTGVNVEPHDLA